MKSNIVFLNFDFKLINCNKLTVIEIGNKKFKVLKKSYPSIKNVGVPNNNKPIPKIDWIVIKTNSIKVSKKKSIW